METGDMVLKHSKKKFIIILSLSVVMVIVVAVYILNFSSFYYNPNWIIGRTYEEIVNRYGEFDLILGDMNHEFFGFYGFYKNESLLDSIERFIFGTDSRYYCIDFDSEGIAYSANKSGYPGG
jgi:hypothetical protein